MERILIELAWENMCELLAGKPVEFETDDEVIEIVLDKEE